MKVREIMVQPAVVVREDATLEEVAGIMLAGCFGCVPVVGEGGELRGIITESDFAAKERCLPFSTFRAPQLFGQWMDKEAVERMYASARGLRAADIMTTPVVTVVEGDPVGEAVELMFHHDINRIPVVRGLIPAGIIARHDLLKMMLMDRPAQPIGRRDAAT